MKEIRVLNVGTREAIGDLRTRTGVGKGNGTVTGRDIRTTTAATVAGSAETDRTRET